MTAQQETLAEELTKRSFVFTAEETDVVVYEKDTRIGSETVTIFSQRNMVLHERWDRTGMLESSTRYNIDRPNEITRLLSSIH